MYIGPVACLIIGIVIGVTGSLMFAIVYGAVNYTKDKGDKK